MEKKSALSARLSTDNEQSQEHRSELRKKANKISFINRNKNLIRSEVVDVSTHGIGVEAVRPVEKGEVVELMITHQDAYYLVSINVKMTVQNCVEVNKECYRIGGQIKNPPPSFLKLFELGEEVRNHTSNSYLKRIGISEDD